MAIITPRPYQIDAKKAIFDAFDRGVQVALVEMPTGTGKTVLFADVGDSREWGKVLVLANRVELIEQAAEKIESLTGDVPDIEMADQYAPTLATDLFASSKYVVGSVQTLSKTRRMSRFDWKDFGLVVIDEGHHAPASSYLKLINHIRTENPKMKFLLVSATFDRADGKKMRRVGNNIEVAFRYRIDEAINDGYLVGVDQYFAHVDRLDFSALHTNHGDFDEGELSALLRDDGGEMPHKVAGSIVNAVGNKRTLVFTVDVAHAYSVASILTRMGKKAVAADGTVDKEKRRAILQAHKRDEFQFLINCMLWVEGYDDPGLEAIANARPTKSRSLYAQMLGRGLRPLAGLVDAFPNREDSGKRRDAIGRSSKPSCLVVDLAGNSGKHKLICSIDVLGREYDAKVVERARKKLPKRKTPVNMQALLEEEKERLEREREAADARREARKAGLIPDVRTTLVQVDAFGNDVIPHGGLEKDRSQLPMARSSQIELIAKIAGIDAIGWTHNEAQSLIADHFRRKKAGLATLRQVRQLEKHGLDWAREVSKDKAGALLDLLAANKWQGLPILAPKQVRIRPIAGDKYRVVAEMPSGKREFVGPEHSSVDDARNYGRKLVGEM